MKTIEDLVGKTIKKIVGKKGDDEISFLCEGYLVYKMYHSQECCEKVTIEDICGDLDDLLNTPVVEAFEKTNKDENPEGVRISNTQDSWTWTFYTIKTRKGTVTIRWYGESNGYYSESVDLIKFDPLTK
ncbi:MAG: hypothetical protein PHY02_10855 [Phycisphaerae bacterium]|nr:hypothetical protein [Phycisphaerae bacterium]